MTFAASLKSIRLMHLGYSPRRRFSFSQLRVVCRCSGCTRPLVGVPTYLPTFSCIFHNCIRRGRFIFLPEKLLRPIRLSLMEQSWMVRNVRLQSQRKPRRHSTCTRGINVYGHHNGLEVCAPEIDRSAHPCGRSRYSGYPVICLAFPDSSITERTQMTKSSSWSPPSPTLPAWKVQTAS
jgi:hypothetical protein